MQQYYDKINKTVRIIQLYITEHTPEFTIILGSEFSKLKDEVKVISETKCRNVPNFPKSTVSGHKGKLICGKIQNRHVLMIAGHVRYYEGYSMQEVTSPIRVFVQLDIERLMPSNALGGVNPDFSIGGMIIIHDHIDLFPEHPLRGRDLSLYGVRLPDMSKPYSHAVIAELEKIVQEDSIKVQKGVCVGLQGPPFETPAEYDIVRILGGDAVGMSIVPEVVVARHQLMEVCALSVITGLGGPEISPDISHEEVLNAASIAMLNMTLLVKNLIKSYK